MTDKIRREGETLIDFARRLKEAAEPAKVWDADLIPDVDEITRSPEQLEMDAVLGKLDIIEAYLKWCGKMVPDVGSKRESIMVSCPNPVHPDAHPSAWVNLDKGDGGVGHCEPCSLGFDKYDIAAWHFGYDVPGYKRTDFPELRRKMAEGLGYRVMVSGKAEWLEEITTVPLPATTPAESAPILRVVDPDAIPDHDDLYVDPEYDVEDPTFNWRDCPAIEPGTFLHDWLTLTSESYEPEEFYFWLGLMALGCGVGNHVTYDDTIAVRANLMVCLVGATGTGKSIAISIFEDLIRRALPFNEASAHGVRLVASPGSGEALLDQFNYVVTDVATATKERLPINGLYRENELAAFVKRTGRAGNTMREIVMDLYDRPLPVSGSSRGAGTVTVMDHFMQMVTSTQHESISRLLTDADAAAGFLNRWVFGFGGAKVRPPRNAVRLDTTSVVDALRDIRAWGLKGRVIQFHDPAAAIAWDEFYLADVHPLTMQEDAWMAARLPLLAKKLMLLFAINNKLTTVTVAHVESAKVMWPYLLTCYGIVSKNVGMSEVQNCGNKIEEYLRARPTETFTLREIIKQSSARRFSREIVRKAIEVLVWGAIIEEVPRVKADRVPRYQYCVHPSSPMASVTSITRSS